MRLAILGAGAWGTALCLQAATQHTVALYARDAAHARLLDTTRRNPRYLPGVAIPAAVEIHSEVSAAVAAADLVVIATPVAGLRPCCEQLAAPGALNRTLASEPAVVWVCKGFEETSLLLPHHVVEEVLPGARYGVLSGPSFAIEVAKGLPAALTVAAAHAALQDLVVEAFHAEALRVYKSADVIGVEVGGAVKNVLAIATGIADGLELGFNARAALITRGLSEMMRLGEALGGRPETLMGLTGMGDLILTCTGSLSRNRQVGLALGQGKSLPEVLAKLGHVAEGVLCAQSVRKLAARHTLEMPITDAVCAVLFEGMAPEQAVQRLLARSPRAES